MNILAVGIGGFFGAVSRYGVYLLSSRFLPAGFPYATLIVNALGSFLLGILFAETVRGAMLERLLLLLSVGFMGAFTTFSTYSLDLIILYKSGHPWLFLLNLLVNLLFAVPTALLGLRLAS